MDPLPVMVFPDPGLLTHRNCESTLRNAVVGHDTDRPTTTNASLSTESYDDTVFSFRDDHRRICHSSGCCWRGGVRRKHKVVFVEGKSSDDVALSLWLNARDLRGAHALVCGIVLFV